MSYMIGLVLSDRTERTEQMDKLSLEALRVNAGISREKAAKLIGVSLDRYNRLASGESKLLAVEFIKIHEIYNVAYERIEIKS